MQIVGMIISALSLGVAAFIAYINQKARADIAEVRASIADMENRIVRKINGTYVRADRFQDFIKSQDERHDGVNKEIERLRNRAHDIAGEVQRITLRSE